MPFADSTRLKYIPLPVLTKPTGGGLTQIDLPKTGILSHIYLYVTATVAGTLSAPNALGAASIINRLSLTVNGGQKLFDMSGAGYHYIVRDAIGEQASHLSWTTARSAVTATTFDLSMIIPVAMNIRDEVGLFMLQNEGTLATLQLLWEADATVATGATVTATATPYLGVFEVPSDPKNWPAFDSIHQIIEEQPTISGAGQFTHNIPRGGTLLGMGYLIPSTTYTLAELVLQQSNIIESMSPNAQQLRFDHFAMGRDFTLAGAITGINHRVIWDWAGSDGLGQFGTFRDVIDTQALTSLFTRLTVGGASACLAVRRQLLPLAA